jgi:hypothetical protein
MFSYTPTAFWFNNNKLSTRIQFLHSKEVTWPLQYYYCHHFGYA